MRAKVTVDLNKIQLNAAEIIRNCAAFGVEVTAVTKMHGADIHISRALLEAGITRLADSRIENLKNLKELSCEKWLLRLPSLSNCEDVILYSDVSCNSEIETIELLNYFAGLHKKNHEVILMWDLGDLREGYLNMQDLISTAEKINKMKNISIVGLGTNLSCYGGIMPTMDNLTQLRNVANNLEAACDLKLKYISGGNSTSYTLIHDGMFPKGVNNLRIGDTFYFGRDMSRRSYIDGMQHDCFVLHCEIIEIKEKPSVPIGVSGYAALNTKPVFEEKGVRKRAICSVGKQDIDVDILPHDKNLSVLGASSDHLLVDITDSEQNYKIGDLLSFNMLYTSVMRAFTSKYIDKEYVR